MPPQWPAAPGVVSFPDGTAVRARGLRRHPAPEPPPELGIYLGGRRPAPVPWTSRWIRWPDFRLPADRDEAVTVLVDGLRRAAGERVEVACPGGRGRTGTALAVMAVAAGVPPRDAVAWVRERYDRRAVETRGQRRWIEGLELG